MRSWDERIAAIRRWSWRRLHTQGHTTLPEPQLTKQFRYSPLNQASNLRLVWLEPGRKNNIIKLSVFEALFPKLSDLEALAPQPQTGSKMDLEFTDYYALSYAWGNARPKRQIIVNDALFDITTNLHQFFETARHPRERRGPYWVDAICINQADDEEKSKQVAMMGEIYKGTQEAIMWLGIEENDSHKAFDLLLLIEQEALWYYERKHREHPEWPVAADGSAYMSNLTTVLLRDRLEVRQMMLECMDKDFLLGYRYHKCAWLGMSTFWCRPWFQRLWTVQEFILPENLILLCGDRRLNVATIIICIHTLMALWIKDQRTRGLTQEAEQAQFIFRRAVTGRMLFHQVVQEPYSLLAAARDHRHRSASDDRDKIFGLMGIACDGMNVNVDYKASTYHVYHSVAVQYLQAGAYWPILSEAGYPRSIPGLPSWVPDWSTGSLPKPADFVPEAYLGVFGSSFNPEPPRISDDGSTLCSKGIVLATIRKIKIYTEDIVTPKAMQELVESLPERRAAAREMVVSGPLKDSPTFKDGDSALREIIRRTIFCDVAILDGVTKRIDELNQDEMMTSVTRNYARGRAFFITGDDLIGVAPLQSEVGDILALLTCVKMPFILRLKDGQVKLVGPCYVAGIMDGQLMENDVIKQRLQEKLYVEIT